MLFDRVVGYLWGNGVSEELFSYHVTFFKFLPRVGEEYLYEGQFFKVRRVTFNPKDRRIELYMR